MKIRLPELLWYGNKTAEYELPDWTKNWEQTLEVLNGSFGKGTQAAVVPNATMQYFSTWV